MSNLRTLGSDVHGVLASLPLPKEKAAELAIDAGMMVGQRIKRALSKGEYGNTFMGSIYPSEVGHPCMRKLWYDRWYDPKTMKPTEKIGPQAKFKFMYGDMLESIAVPLLKATGRVITGVDERLERKFTDASGYTWTISGRTDVVVDDCVVDIKSMSGISYRMYTTKGIPGADTFGYRWQLHTYNWLRNKANDSGLLGINKENGAVDFIRNETTVLAQVETRLQAIASSIVSQSHVPSGLPDEPEGASGNRKVSSVCSYCKYKEECWRGANGGAGLRLFLYAGNKPVYLTEVKREPKVPEVK